MLVGYRCRHELVSVPQAETDIDASMIETHKRST